MTNPFRFGQIVSGDLFCNRKSEISQITDNLAGGQSIVLYSPRRYGKTSLLYAVSNGLRSNKILVGYVDFFACNSTEKILLAVSRASAKAIVDEMKSIEKFIKRAAHFFNRIRFSIRFDPNVVGSISVLPELSSRATSMDILSDALSGLNSFLNKNNKRAAIVLDEFQQIIKVDSNLEAEFRTIIQQQDRIAFAFLGSRMHLLKEMFINKNRPFYRAAKIMELGPITTDELAKFIKKPFRGVFEELPSRESQVMTILAEHGPIGTFTAKLIQPYDMGTPALHKALSNLMLKDLVFKGKDKNYFILDPFLTEWIRMVSNDAGQFSF